MTAERDSLRVALISDVFFGEGAAARLDARLAEARAAGAELAVLPEIGVDPWSPATRLARDEDAEPPGGPRERLQSAAAARAGIALVGAAIVRDPDSGTRHDRALVFDAAGRRVASYAKLHLPEEPGFWETSHYEPGGEPPRVVPDLGFPFGLQICSDANRPQGCQLLGAAGALAVFVPRSTEQVTWPRWRPVFVANALTTAMYVASVNRPAPEQGVLIGGPSIVVAPDGEVLLETTDPVAVVTLERRRVLDARKAYPGYLPVRADLYARAWGEAAADA